MVPYSPSAVRNRVISVLLLSAAGLRAFPDDPYLGAAACAQCHPAQAASHAATGHARSLHPAASHPLFSSIFPSAWLQRPPDFRLRYEAVNKQPRVRAHDGKDTMDIPVDWAFGAGDQAVTLVSRIDRDWYLEHAYTFYAALGGMALTAGHSELRPQTLPEAMGLPYKTADPQTGIKGCFECHSTGPVRIDATSGLRPGEAGVQCEACHGPGREHAAAGAKGRIANPKRLSAAGVNEFCGRCHRPPAGGGTAIDWSYAWNVRHQPVYLSQSKCMKNSQGKLSCFTCHEPHRPLQKSAAAYNQRCLACHAATTAAACRTNCIDCHMPRVSPQPALRFTNHRIGVYEGGSKLKPR